ncbi:hypothetical protein PENTCL1PPCAC_15733, partial [Pristionchus entomophagus]
NKTQNASLSSIYGQLLETLHAMAMLVVVLILIFSQPSWKNQVATSLGLQKLETRPISVKVSNASQITTAYFGDLAKAWD